MLKVISQWESYFEIIENFLGILPASSIEKRRCKSLRIHQIKKNTVYWRLSIVYSYLKILNQKNFTKKMLLMIIKWKKLTLASTLF